MPFIVKQNQFEGPLDLLLTLIEKRKLFVNDIALAQVTDDFIEHIRTVENFPISDSAHFILIASTLLLIKSKSLLPTLDLTSEEEQGIEDLETRLKIYQEIKQAAIGIQKMFGKEIIFQAERSGFQARLAHPIFSPDDSLRTSSIAKAIADLIRALPKKELIPKAVVQKVVSLEEMITRLTERISSSLKMSFREFSKNTRNNSAPGNSAENIDKKSVENIEAENRANKVHVIVSFLAMLELVKQGIIHVTQELPGDDIQMETQATGVPRYM